MEDKTNKLTDKEREEIAVAKASKKTNATYIIKYIDGIKHMVLRDGKY